MVKSSNVSGRPWGRSLNRVEPFYGFGCGSICQENDALDWSLNNSIGCHISGDRPSRFMNFLFIA